MIIAHVSPFAPNRCGLYEMARDMARADIYGGHQVIFVDAGTTEKEGHVAGKEGKVDERAGFKIVTSNPIMLDEADIIIMHTGIADGYLARNLNPVIWVVHGRPLACFRPEINGQGASYSLYIEVSKWKRTKRMMYFWKEFEQYWKPFFNGKDLILDYPLIDETRFKNEGCKHTLNTKGKYNIMVCDSQRVDYDLFEMVNGLIHACKKHSELKIHFFGFDFPLPTAWNVLLGKLKEVGGLGDLYARVSNMELVYRACDCLISPNRIITRTIGEALSCGIPVISQNNPFNKLPGYQCDMTNTDDIVRAVDCFIDDFDNNKINNQDIKNTSKVFNMDNYCKVMNKVYDDIHTSGK